MASTSNTTPNTNPTPVATTQTTGRSSTTTNAQQTQASVLSSYPNVRTFGGYSNPIAVYPNDAIQLDIFNANEQYLETNYRVSNFIQDGTTLTLNLEKNLSDLGYISGKYRAQYKINRNLLGSGDAHKMRIQEISADGLEVRVVPAASTEFNNADFNAFFADKFFNIPKAQTLVNLFLYKDANTTMRVFDYVQDKFTFAQSPYSVIFKLNSPAPSEVVIGDLIWLTQQVSETIIDSVTIVPPKPKSTKIIIAGPNWDALSKEANTAATQYKDWDDLLTTNQQTSQDIINKLLSSSFIEGIPLNIDYRKFENYVNFGSATERLHNFKYKVELLENYNARIEQLTTNLNGLPSSSVSASNYFQNNILDAKTKKAALLGSLDGYEKYLYFESSSYVSNSFGEFYPTTWPKINSTYPYTNYSFTASQTNDWFEGIIQSASIYDTNNENGLYKLVPAHIQNDDANEEYLLLTQMIGHYFDLMFAYIKQMSLNTSREESVLDGFSKELVYHVARNLGIDFENGNTLEDLWLYALGTDQTGSLTSTYGVSSEDKTKETWKRIINNLPYLLKTKGTERGVRALINCFGIPQTILRIREYGGAEPEFTSKTDLVYERGYYATNVGYNGTTGSYVANLIQAPWQKLTENNQAPYTVELRAAMAPNQTKNQTIFEVPGNWQVRAFKSASNDYVGFFLSGSQGWATASVSTSFYDGTYHHIALTRDTAVNPTFTLILKKTNYNKVVSTQTASLFINATTSASYVTSYETTGSLWIPGSGSFTAAQSSSMQILTGSVQELRYWTAPLENTILDNHTLAPTSFQGNTDGVFTGSTSSYYSLGFRLCLGADSKKIDLNATSSLTSQHPNQDNIYFSGSLYKSGSFYNFPSGSGQYKSIVEINSLEWPDLGGNRSISNKIRIDQSITVAEQLYRNTKVERPLSDNYPPDSSRLGIYLAPVNELNQDIAEQFGGLSIDDYIGDPSYLTLNHYPGLDSLKYEYLRKYKGRNNPQNYIRLLRYYDAALFKLIKKFVPYRANTQVGLVLEPNILDRSKVPTNVPSIEQLHWSASIQLPYNDVSGFVQDGDGEPFRDGSGYVKEGVIQQKYVTPAGELQQVRQLLTEYDGIQLTSSFERTKIDYVIVDGTINNLVTPGGTANEYNNTGVANDPSISGSTFGKIDLGISAYGRDTRVQGSQYTFYTIGIQTTTVYVTSSYGTGSYGTGSYAGTASYYIPYTITSSRYDYHEPFCPVIMDSRRSEFSNVTGEMYDVNIYYNQAFTNISSYGSLSPSGTYYSSSAALYTNRWTQDFGLRFISLEADAVNVDVYQSSNYWFITGSTGLSFNKRNLGNNITASAIIPAFFYNTAVSQSQDYLYEISVTTAHIAAALTARLELHYGNLDNGLSTSSISLTTTDTTYTYTVLANGPWLGLRFFSTGLLGTPNTLYIKSLKVKCLNYKSQTQDFHLRDSYGMRNARYDGCKMTSTDYNVNSLDTSDGGPVITITVGGGKQLSVRPNVRGNLRID